MKKAIDSAPNATITADGEQFDSSKLYYFYDKSRREVISTLALRSRDDGWVYSMGYRIVQIEKLRAERRTALSDAQKIIENEIAERQEFILRLEAEKGSCNNLQP